jgi:dienelactone hydrolase
VLWTYAMSIRFSVAAVGVLVTACASTEPIPNGAGELRANLSKRLTVFTYRPSNCENPSLLLVFHGVGRNASGYRDYARPIADRECMIVVAPLFDKNRFPSWRYQMGGIVHDDEVQKKSTWTGNLVTELVDWVRDREGRKLDYSLIGHSAGGQFLSRVTAFTPTQARRTVIANPSTHVFPMLEIAAPFGLGAVYPKASAEAELRRYLEGPVTIFLGQEDTGDDDLNESLPAMAQGENRHERGLNVYAKGKKVAAENNWNFGWRLVELPGVGHSARKMFSSEEARAALKP